MVTNSGESHHGCHGPFESPSEGISLFLIMRALEQLLKELRVSLNSEKVSISFLGKTHDSKVLRLAQDLLTELEERRMGYEIILKSGLLQILVYLFRHCLEPTVVKAKPDLPRQLPLWQMNRAIEYMSEHGKSSFSLSELCNQIGTSTSRLIRLFKNSANMRDPHTYFNELLIEKAQALLQSGKYSVKEVAYELGFKNYSHFCTAFRHVSGMTPNTFRMLSGTTNADRYR